MDFSEAKRISRIIDERYETRQVAVILYSCDNNYIFQAKFN